MNIRPLYSQNSRPEIVKFLPNQYSKVLEIGCSDGDFIKNLNQECEYWGIEPNKHAVKIASEKLDKVLNGLYDKVYDQLPDRYFDLVICNDVIEHMDNHELFLSTIKQKMSDCSFIVGSVPNVRFFYNLFELLIKKDWQYQEWGILDRTHLRFFTEKSLTTTLIKSGYIIESLFGINAILMNPISIKRLIRSILIYLIGQDSRFLQFGFRVKYLRNNESKVAG